VKFTVTVTLVGRLDGMKDTGLIRDSGGKVIGLGGFGNLNRYNARLVLQSVSEISSQQIDCVQGGAPLPRKRHWGTAPLRQEHPLPTKLSELRARLVRQAKIMESALASVTLMKFPRTTA
jgi:hypothetical protein